VTTGAGVVLETGGIGLITRVGFKVGEIVGAVGTTGASVGLIISGKPSANVGNGLGRNVGATGESVFGSLGGGVDSLGDSVTFVGLSVVVGTVVGEVEIFGSMVGLLLPPVVGCSLGILVGPVVGCSLGVSVGPVVGFLVGVLVGTFVGAFVGGFVGAFVGAGVGSFVGDSVGLLVGLFVGSFVGLLVGSAVGSPT